SVYVLFSLTHTVSTRIYLLSLHDALPISGIMFLFLVIFNGTIANTMEFLGSNIIGSDINSGVNITFGNKNISSTSALIELFAKDTLWNRFVIDVSIQFFALAVGFMFG